jgi:hypothetical protein
MYAEILDCFALESSETESLGDADTFGWFACFEDFLAILNTDSQGFVTATVYDTLEEVKDAWWTIRSAYEAWEDASDDWREADRTEPDYSWDYAH